jgi:hypothetical protein
MNLSPEQAPLKPREKAKSFHEKDNPSQAGFVVSFEWSSMELIRLCRHPSIRTLLLSDFRSAQVGRPQFSRCCYLINGVWPSRRGAPRRFPATGDQEYVRIEKKPTAAA